MTPAEPGAAPPIDGRQLPHGIGAAVRRLATEAVARGERPSRVMARFGLCRTTIYRWLRVLDESGPRGLARRIHPGRAPRVAKARHAELRDAVVDHTPLDHGLAVRVWTCAATRDLVEARWGIRLGLVAAGRLLRRSGLRPHLNDPSAGARAEGPGLLFAVDGRGAFLCTRLRGTCAPRELHRRMDALAQRAQRAVRFVVAEDPARTR